MGNQNADRGCKAEVVVGGERGVGGSLHSDGDARLASEDALKTWTCDARRGLDGGGWGNVGEAVCKIQYGQSSLTLQDQGQGQRSDEVSR